MVESLSTVLCLSFLTDLVDLGEEEALSGFSHDHFIPISWTLGHRAQATHLTAV